MSEFKHVSQIPYKKRWVHSKRGKGYLRLDESKNYSI